jgi:hypothetical protein
MERASLTPKQESVMLRLLGGESQSEAAANEGVDPTTLSRWMRLGSAFEEIYRERRSEIWESHKQRIVRLVGVACNRIYDMMLDDDQAIALKAIDRGIKMLTALAPSGFNYALSSQQAEEQTVAKHYSNDYYEGGRLRSPSEVARDDDKPVRPAPGRPRPGEQLFDDSSQARCEVK